MVMFHISYALELLALGLGIGLLIWAMREKGNGVTLGKVFGYIISIFSVILILCTFWSNVIIWRMHQQMMRMQMHPMMIQQILQQRMPAAAVPRPAIMPHKPMPLHKPQTNAAPAAKAVHNAKATAPKQAASKELAHKPATANKPANANKSAAANNNASATRANTQ